MFNVLNVKLFADVRSHVPLLRKFLHKQFSALFFVQILHKHMGCNYGYGRRQKIKFIYFFTVDNYNKVL